MKPQSVRSQRSFQNPIIVVGCTKKKKSYPCIASEMYSESVLFSKTVSYIKSYYKSEYVILSAKYGIIYPTTYVEPYDTTMKGIIRCTGTYTWMRKEIARNLCEYDKIIAFCGQDYIKMLRIALPDTCIIEPLKGMGIGQRLQFLTERCC
jgi:hypothetical protein